MRHAARLETSERLQRVLAILRDNQWHSSFDLMMRTNLVAIGSAISELRANGFIIECECLGQGRYQYRLILQSYSLQNFSPTYSEQEFIQEELF